MYDEQLEFAISQYADGTLPAARRAALEAQIAADPALEALLAEYRHLTGALDSLPQMPAINFERLSDHISQQIAQAEEERARVFQMPWVRRIAGLAVAASVALVIGIGLEHRSNSVTHVTAPAAGEIAVAGPAPEAPAGAVVAQISIGPSPSVAMDDSTWRYGDSGVVAPAQRVVIASSDAPAQDNSATPY
jgi:anti-sigma factor RsiW